MRTDHSFIGASTRNRVLVIIGVIALSLWIIYPIQNSLKLGLDLDGGVQLVLRVKTDDMLLLQTQAAAERLRTALTEARVSFSTVGVVSATEFRVHDIGDESALRRAADEFASIHERTSAGGTHTFRLPPGVANALRDQAVEQALRTIERRVNDLGVAESVIARYTAADQILVQLPGVSDVDGAKQVIKSTAQLRLTLVDRGPFASRDAALLAYNNALPSDLEILPGKADRLEATTAPFYVVQRVPALTGNDLRSARQAVDELNRPAVGFTLERDAARRFGAITERNIDRLLATVLDNRVMSVATIQSRIDDQGQITGVSREEMIEQVINLNSGALPADLEYVEERTVGASLGAASVRAGVLASLGGLGLVLLFMLSYYRQAGVNALISVALNLLILLALMANIPVTLTLPGIAGLILTIGMGVDSNVLIFERIKEELAAAAGPRSAVKAAFTRVWLTIVDTHVTAFIAAAFLFQFGTMPIRGFATTLAIGLLANVFTAVFVSRTLFEIALRRRPMPHTLSIGGARLFGNARTNFTRWRWHALVLSLVIVGAGMATVLTKGLPLGIDFVGGTLVVVEFEREGVTEEQVRTAVSVLPGDEIVQRYGGPADRQFQIRLPLLSSGSGGLEGTVQQIAHALQASRLGEFDFEKRELVSAVIGADLQRRGIYAVGASLAAIALYIGIRFRFAFAVGAIAATVHDVLVTLACVSLAGYDLSLNVIAALLTIIGYSVNDTIVIFDRVRENARRMPAEGLDAIVNLSVNQTLSRTVITAGTTFLSVVALYALGGEALRGFAFTMLVGIVAGTYSTVFIASATAILLSGKRALRRRSRSTTRDGEQIVPAR
ncbi:MAG TPA: protein translocase subunit SecD [Vicinamibacterales bacterium]|nr:protein translocase subunit SecD [Vicinamibacterales bacterium]